MAEQQQQQKPTNLLAIDLGARDAYTKAGGGDAGYAASSKYLAQFGMTREQLIEKQPEIEARKKRVSEGGGAAQFTQGALWGGGDEASSFLEAHAPDFMLPENVRGQTYDQRLEANRQLLEDTEIMHPKASTALSIGGGVASSIPAAGELMFVKGLGWVSKALLGGAGGASQAGTQAFLEGEGGAAQRAQNVPAAAGVGGVLGTVAGPAGAGLAKAWTAVGDKLLRSGVAQQSVAKILKVMQDMGVTPQEAEQRLDQLGYHGVLGDVNPGMQVATGATAARDPAAQALVTQRLKERRLDARSRVEPELDRNVGPPVDPFDQMTTQKAQQRGVGPEYEQALSNAQPMPKGSGGVGEQIGDRLTNMAYGPADIAQVTKWTSQIDHALNAPTPEAAVRRLQRLKFRINAQIERDPAKRFHMSSADKADQGVLQDIEATIDDTLKDYAPGYREADEAFTPIAQQREAYEAGREMINPKVSDAQHRAELAAANPTEQEMRRGGLRYELSTKMEDPRVNPAIQAENVLARPSTKRKVEQLIGRNKAENIDRMLEREKTFVETSNLAEAGRGSRTANLTQVGESMWGTPEQRSLAGHMSDIMAAGGPALASGDLGNAALASGAVILSKGVQGARKASADKVNEKTAQLIRRVADDLTVTGVRRSKLIQALKEEAAALPGRARNAETIRRLGKALVQGVGRSAPGAEQAQEFVAGNNRGMF